jgi:hypothetical protein
MLTKALELFAAASEYDTIGGKAHNDTTSSKTSRSVPTFSSSFSSLPTT